jgi:ABC-type dipeptide/oligopeptide/nickel transport system permease component
MDATDTLWTRRARPTFLYVMYLMILASLPMGLLAAFSPDAASRMTSAISAYLSAIPDAMWTLFATGYLGYTAARQWGKVKGGVG